MSHPSVLGPWFVVQRLLDDGTISGDYVGLEYFRSAEDGAGMWTRDPRVALLYMSLHSASRVAQAEGAGAHVRVLYDQEGAEEFGRG